MRINQALYSHGLTQAIIGSTEARHREYITNDPTARYLKIIDSELDDQIIAFAEWHIFSTASKEAARLDLAPRTWPSDVNLPLATEYWGHIVNARKGMTGKPHVFLSVIATAPGQGRRGAASLLMEWGVGEADRRGLPCFLESSPMGRGLYLKHGFEEVESFEVDLGEREMYTHFVMVRPAK